MVRFCNLVAPLILIFRTSWRKANFVGHVYLYKFKTALLFSIVLQQEEIYFNLSCIEIPKMFKDSSTFEHFDRIYKILKSRYSIHNSTLKYFLFVLTMIDRLHDILDPSCCRESAFFWFLNILLYLEYINFRSS